MVDLFSPQFRMFDLTPNPIDGRGFRETPRAIEDIPDCGISEGDWVVHAYSAQKRHLKRIRVPFTQLPRTKYQALLDGFNSLQLVARFSPHRTLRRNLKNSMAQRGKQPGPVVIVRPLWSGVSEPIHAASAEAAIFELIRPVGCRMPKEV